jgi:hypothetical protein
MSMAARVSANGFRRFPCWARPWTTRGNEPLAWLPVRQAERAALDYGGWILTKKHEGRLAHWRRSAVVCSVSKAMTAHRLPTVNKPNGEHFSKRVRG